LQAIFLILKITEMAENQNLLERFDRLETLLLGQKNILTFEEMCQYRGISKSHGYKETSARKLPYSKPDGKIMYFRREDVEAYMMQNQVKTKTQLEKEVKEGLGRK
jgi:excisionase family DNA binding protein